MRKFIVATLCVSVFFIGLGAMVEKAGASLRSDEKALALIAQARQAIGGDQAISEVRSMVIKGSTTHTLTFDGVERTETGETEIVMQLPDKLMRSVRVGKIGEAGDAMARFEGVTVNTADANAPALVDANGQPVGKRLIVKRMANDGTADEFEIKAESGEFVTEDGKKIVVKRTDGSQENKVIVRTKDGNTEAAAINGETMNLEGGKSFRVKRAGSPAFKAELVRTTLGLLLSAPEGVEVSYKFAGEGDVDGTPANIIEAGVGGSVIKLYLSRSSSLPLMISFDGPAMGHIIRIRKGPVDDQANEKDIAVFARELEAPEASSVLHEVRFSDFRSTGGVQLPYRWTTSVGGKTTEVLNVASYEINPADIADRFAKNKVRIRRTEQK